MIRIKPKSNDESTTFSIRIHNELKAAFDELADQTGRSRNELISMAMEHFAENAVVDNKEGEQ